MCMVSAVPKGVFGPLVGLVPAHSANPKESGFMPFVLKMLAAGFVGLVLGFIAGPFTGFSVPGRRRANAPDSAY